MLIKAVLRRDRFKPWDSYTLPLNVTNTKNDANLMWIDEGLTNVKLSFSAGKEFEMRTVEINPVQLINHIYPNHGFKIQCSRYGNWDSCNLPTLSKLIEHISKDLAKDLDDLQFRINSSGVRVDVGPKSIKINPFLSVFPIKGMVDAILPVELAPVSTRLSGVSKTMAFDDEATGLILSKAVGDHCYVRRAGLGIFEFYTSRRPNKVTLFSRELHHLLSEPPGADRLTYNLDNFGMYLDKDGKWMITLPYNKNCF